MHISLRLRFICRVMWMWTTCAAMRYAMNPKMHAHPSIPSSSPSPSSSSWPGPLLCVCAFKIVCVHLLWVHRKQKWNQVYTRKTNESGQKKRKEKFLLFCTCILLSNIFRTLRSCPHGWRHRRHVLGALLCWAVKRPETTATTATTTTNGLNGAFFGQGLEQWPKRFTASGGERKRWGK